MVQDNGSVACICVFLDNLYFIEYCIVVQEHDGFLRLYRITVMYRLNLIQGPEVQSSLDSSHTLPVGNQVPATLMIENNIVTSRIKKSSQTITSSTNGETNGMGTILFDFHRTL